MEMNRAYWLVLLFGLTLFAIAQPDDQNQAPPRSGSAPGESSSKSTKIDLSPPPNDTKDHPESGTAVSEAEGSRSWGFLFQAQELSGGAGSLSGSIAVQAKRCIIKFSDRAMPGEDETSRGSSGSLRSLLEDLATRTLVRRGPGRGLSPRG